MLIIKKYEAKQSSVVINKDEFKEAAMKAYQTVRRPLFKINVRGADCYPETMAGGLIENYWRVDNGRILRCSYTSGKPRIIEKIKYKDIADVENILADEFEALNDTLEIGENI